MSEEPTGKPPLEFPEQGAPALTNKQRMTIHRHAMPELGAEAATRSFEEVALGYALHDAREEALRCLQCKKPTCVQSCPMQTDIPGFIKKTSEGDLVGAYQILVANNLMCSICSRVCPQEQQCEGGCSLIKAKTDSVAIGNLERFGLHSEALRAIIRPQTTLTRVAMADVLRAGAEARRTTRSARQRSLHEAALAALIVTTLVLVVVVVRGRRRRRAEDAAPPGDAP